MLRVINGKDLLKTGITEPKVANIDDILVI